METKEKKHSLRKATGEPTYASCHTLPRQTRNPHPLALHTIMNGPPMKHVLVQTFGVLQIFRKKTTHTLKFIMNQLLHLIKL